MLSKLSQNLPQKINKFVIILFVIFYLAYEIKPTWLFLNGSPDTVELKEMRKQTNRQKKATHKNKIDVNIPLSDTEIKHILKFKLEKKRQKLWKETKSSNLKMIQQAKLHFNSWDLPRWKEVILHRLRLGVCRNLKSFLHKMGKHPDGICDTCNNSYDNVNRLLFNCKKYQQNRDTLQKTWDIQTHKWT